MIAKIVALLIYVRATAPAVLSSHNIDFLSARNNLIIYADGTPIDILEKKQPIMYSWRPNILEIRNMCLLAQCNYQFMQLNSQPNRFLSTKCYLVKSGNDCESEVEKNVLYTFEELLHISDYATSLTLGDQKFGLVGSCKSEEAIVVMEVKKEDLEISDNEGKEDTRLKLR